MSACERTFSFPLIDSEDLSGYVDIAQCLSLINRKMYRQGMQYVVEKIEIQGSSGSGAVTILVNGLPENWTTANSWVKFYSAWQQQQHEALEGGGAGSMKAKWRDFKIYADQQHRIDGIAKNYLPNGFTLADLPTNAHYEYDSSQVVIPNYNNTPGDAQELTMHMLGEDLLPIGLGMVHHYARSRARPNVPDPNVVAPQSATPGPGEDLGGFLVEMFDVGMDDPEILENIADKNDYPPYFIADSNDSNLECYPGGHNVATTVGSWPKGRAILSTSGANIRTIIPGFVAPCGLLRIAPNSFVNLDSAVCYVTIAAGPYQGVMARPMKEAN